MGQENLPWELVEGKTRADDPRFWPGGAQLSGETFENALIVDVDITAAELIGATFRNCTLARLDLRDGFMSGATFEDCTFYKCDLRRADLSGASLKNVTIDRSNLCSAKLSGMTTSNFQLTRSEASPCDFRNSKLDAVFSYCDLSAVNFDGASITDLTLYRCNVKFSRVDAKKIECTTTGIEAAERAGDHQVPWFLASDQRLDSPPQGDIQNSYFFGKDLSNKDFSNRTLKNTHFLRCNLVETNFSNTTFDNVWFWDCEVDQLKMPSAKVERLTMCYVMGTIDASNSDFKIWNVYDSELESSNFQGAAIHAGTFSMSQLPDCNFSHMKAFIVESFMTDFMRCDFTQTNTSQHAAERSYFDEGFEPLPISKSPLRNVKKAGDTLDFYLYSPKSAPQEAASPFSPATDKKDSSLPFAPVAPADGPEKIAAPSVSLSSGSKKQSLNLAPLPEEPAKPTLSKPAASKPFTPFDFAAADDDSQSPASPAPTATPSPSTSLTGSAAPTPSSSAKPAPSKSPASTSSAPKQPASPFGRKPTGTFGKKSTDSSKFSPLSGSASFGRSSTSAPNPGLATQKETPEKVAPKTDTNQIRLPEPSSSTPDKPKLDSLNLATPASIKPAEPSPTPSEKPTIEAPSIDTSFGSHKSPETSSIIKNDAAQSDRISLSIQHDQQAVSSIDLTQPKTADEPPVKQEANKIDLSIGDVAPTPEASSPKEETTESIASSTPPEDSFAAPPSNQKEETHLSSTQERTSSSQQTEKQSTDIVRSNENLGFFARLIMWFKSLFGSRN